jgi:hypothetical protein
VLNDFQINKPAPGLENGNSWPHVGQSQTKISRRFQSYLTDEQLAQRDIMVVNAPEKSRFLKQFLDADTSLESGDPILIHASSFEGLAKEIEPEIAASQPNVAAPWWGQFEKRLADLRDIAIEEDIPVSDESLEAASKFASTLVDARTPSAFLIGNGNTRLLWVNDDGEQVGLQFREKARVQYIFFKRVEGEIDEIMGLKSSSTILDFIEKVGLRHLIAE